MDLDLRTVRGEEMGDFFRAVLTGFGRNTPGEDDEEYAAHLLPARGRVSINAVVAGPGFGPGALQAAAARVPRVRGRVGSVGRLVRTAPAASRCEDRRQACAGQRQMRLSDEPRIGRIGQQGRAGEASGHPWRTDHSDLYYGRASPKLIGTALPAGHGSVAIHARAARVGLASSPDST